MSAAPLHGGDPPSPWVVRWAELFAPRSRVLDLACGAGRHARLLASLGHRVLAVDRDAPALALLSGVPGVETRCLDLEASAWPLAGEVCDGAVVTRYLHRPGLPGLLATVRPGGVLIYETYAAGHERYGRPANPDFLLRRGELLEWLGGWTVVAYEDWRIDDPRPALVQRIAAIRPSAGGMVPPPR